MSVTVYPNCLCCALTSSSSGSSGEPSSNEQSGGGSSTEPTNGSGTSSSGSGSGSSGPTDCDECVQPTELWVGGDPELSGPAPIFSAGHWQGAAALTASCVCYLASQLLITCTAGVWAARLQMGPCTPEDPDGFDSQVVVLSCNPIFLQVRFDGPCREYYVTVTE